MSPLYHLVPLVLLVWLLAFLILLQVFSAPTEYLIEESTSRKPAGDSPGRGERRQRETGSEARRRRSLVGRWKVCPAARTTDERGVRT
jgi:hypothetical protein